MKSESKNKKKFIEAIIIPYIHSFRLWILEQIKEVLKKLEVFKVEVNKRLKNMENDILKKYNYILSLFEKFKGDVSNLLNDLRNDMNKTKREINDDVKIATDEVKSQLVDMSKIFPVGYVYITFDNRNPKTILGFGKWERITGRALVGVGWESDGTDSINLKVNQKRGKYFHRLKEDEVPAHRHMTDSSDWRAQVAWGRSHTVKRSGTYDAWHTTDVNYTSFSGGKNAPHNNIMPCIGVNMWRRIL